MAGSASERRREVSRRFRCLAADGFVEASSSVSFSLLLVRLEDYLSFLH